MKYLLLVYTNEKIWDEEARQGQREKCMEDSRQLCHQLAEDDSYQFASPLHPVSTATSIRVREGRVLVTDGPFAETHEQLGGFYMLDVANLDEAIAIAARIPPATLGTIEIRPLLELDNMPGPVLQGVHDQT